MNKQTITRYNCFKSIRAFGAAHSDLFPAVNFAGGLFTQIEQLVERLDALAASQASSTGASIQGTASKNAARRALEELLDAISRAARAMSVNKPGLEAEFRRPQRGSISALVNAARAFLSDAAPLKAEFIKFGLRADFLEQLNSMIEQFEQAVDERNSKAQSRVSARAGLAQAVESGLKLRLQLDAIVRNTLHGDEAALAAWESASHIELVSPRAKRVTNSASKAEKKDSPEKPEAAP